MLAPRIKAAITFFSWFFEEILSHEARHQRVDYKSGTILTTWRVRETPGFINGKDSVKSSTPQQIAFSVKAVKHFINVRMPYRAVFPIRQKILLAYIGGIIAV